MAPTQELIDRIKSNLDDHGMSIVPWPAFAREADTKLNTIYSILSDLRQSGEAPRPKSAGRRWSREPKGDGPKPKSPKAPKLPNLTAEALLAQLEGQTLTDRTKRLQILSWIAENGTDQARIRAIETLEDLERVAGSQYGPPPPTTDEDIHTHLVALFRGLSPEQVAKAQKAAYETPEQPQEDPESTSGTSDSGLGGHTPQP